MVEIETTALKAVTELIMGRPRMKASVTCKADREFCQMPKKWNLSMSAAPGAMIESEQVHTMKSTALIGVLVTGLTELHRRQPGTAPSRLKLHSILEVQQVRG